MNKLYARIAGIAGAVSMIAVTFARNVKAVAFETLSATETTDTLATVYNSAKDVALTVVAVLIGTGALIVILWAAYRGIKALVKKLTGGSKAA